MVKIAKNVSTNPSELIASLKADANKELLTLPVSALQIRRAMRAAGLLVAVETALNVLGEEHIETWEYATQFKRHDPFIVALATEMALKPKDMDDVFVEAREM